VIQKRTHNRAAHVVIDRSAISHNLARVKALVPNSKVMAVIKANGYGHSMAAASQALLEADEFAVTGLDDVSILRNMGVMKPITMLSSSFDVSDLNQMSANSVRPVIYDQEQFSLLSQLDKSAALDIWLKLDTGMGRLGLSIEDAELNIPKLLNNAGIRSISLMTHLANADSPQHPATQKQIDVFLSFAQGYALQELSILNSAGIVSFGKHAQHIVRPGILLYGISPNEQDSTEELGLKPAMSFNSELISVKRLPSGSAIGYGSSYSLDSDTRIGVIACGYADGYPRHAPSGTLVMVNNMLVPIIGRVSMDLITVDLGEMRAEIGDPVCLWGADNPIEQVAEASGTIAYELLCSITERVERIVI